MRRLSLPLAALALSLAAVSAMAQEAADPDADGSAGSAGDLCDRLFVPEGYGLTCERQVGEDAVSERAVVKPLDGDFADFSRLSLRPLDREADALAWEEPERWLEEQMVVDMSGIVDRLQGMAEDPDNPLGGTPFTTALEAIAQSLDSLSRLALTGCGEPEALDEERRRLACSWSLGPVEVLMRLRLVEEGGERYALSLWTMNEQRLRHFEAIANSFSEG